MDSSSGEGPLTLVYTWFRACFRSIEILLNLKIIFGRCLVNPIIQYWRCLFFYKNILFHLFEAGNRVSNSSFK